MKIITTISAVLLFFGISYAQVGINTATPTSTLDVNGTLRVRNMSIQEESSASAKHIVGVDEYGNFVEVEPGRNLKLDDNVLDGEVKTYKIDRDDSIFTGESIHNLVVFPGGPASGKGIVRLQTSMPITELTGIEAAPDGTTVILYPTEGRLQIRNLNDGSLSENQILTNNTEIIKQYSTVQLFYDGDLQKWIIMNQ